LRESGYLLGAISEGKSVKQWQKLIQLGIQHLFHSAAISEEINEEKVTPKLFQKILGELKVPPQETLFVGNQLETDILSANQLNIVSVRIRKGAFMTEEPKDPRMVPKFEIGKLSEVLEIVKKL
jgi:putative hydrolase of the HAD superfamily